MRTNRPGVVAIIPARGGSKGIPKKNVHVVGGKPLIAHSIEAAKRTSQIDETYVSTDDPEIAEVARCCGARVIERPAELANDTASSESALLHAIESIARETGEPRLVIFLQATSPLRDDDDLARALAAFENQHADSMFSATPAHGFMWRLADGARPLNYDPRARPRRQEAPADVIENGSFYIFKPSVLRETGSRLGGKITAHMMRAATSFQIDEPDDLDLMEWLFAKHRPPVVSTVFQANFAMLSATTREVAATLEPIVTAAGEVLATAVARGGKILACGNGGSAADAQHFVAELVGRLKVERRALPGISLSSDPSVVTCLANDYGYDQLFSRQVEAFGAPGDALLAISTSGKSPNVLNAARAARQIGMPVVSLIGSQGDQLAELSDHCVRIPTSDTQCIQELHMVVLHILCASIDQRIVG